LQSRPGSKDMVGGHYPTQPQVAPVADTMARGGSAARRRVARKVRATPLAAGQVEHSMAEETAWLVAEQDLIPAIASLYDDGLRPYGRFIRKRLVERAALDNQSGLEPNLGHLRAACDMSASINVEPADGGEWVGLLVGHKHTFVDFYSTEDNYPEGFWTSFETYLEMLEGDDALLPGGRYACARALVELQLPFLSGWSLGNVCHIVELAMSQRKLLGYLDGAITPYARSNSMKKDAAAEQHVGGNTHHFPFASWADTRSHLAEILDSALRKGKQQVPLSTLKRLFRSRFRTELSETALGYTKVSDLLQDARVSDICTIKLLESGYVVLPQTGFARGAVQSHVTRSKWFSTPRLVLCKDSDVRSIVQNSFHSEVGGTLAFDPSASHRSRSQPRGAHDVDTWSLSQSTFDSRPSDVSVAGVGLECVPELPEPEALSVPENMSDMPRLKLCSDRPLSFEGSGSVSARSGTLSARSGATSARSRRSTLPSPALTASPLYDWVPRGGDSMMRVPESSPIEGTALDIPYVWDGPTNYVGQHCSHPDSVHAPSSRFCFAQDDVLSVDDAGMYGQLPVFSMHDWMPSCDEGVSTLPQTPRSRWSLSPSLLPSDQCLRGIVENSILTAEPPPTPRSACRANSLPRDLGSERATVAVAWETAPNSALDGPCYRLALPSPAVTASDWGTPRTPIMGSYEVEENPRQVLNLSEFL